MDASRLSKRWIWGLVGTLFLAGLVLRLLMLRESAWGDEMSTLWIIRGNDFFGVISTVNSDAEISPPFFFLLAKVSSWIFGQTPTGIRIPSFVAGVLAARPDFDGVICLPGTHTKWVRVSAGEICHFQTVMTGEIFALLSRQSVLRHSMTERSSDARIAAFADAVDTALSRPHQAWAQLFRLRAAGLIGTQAPGAAEGALSGLLIGLDLGAARSYWLGEQVLIIGAPRLSALYASALEQQGAAPVIGDADTATRAGLHAAWRNYQGQS